MLGLYKNTGETKLGFSFKKVSILKARSQRKMVKEHKKERLENRSTKLKIRERLSSLISKETQNYSILFFSDSKPFGNTQDYQRHRKIKTSILCHWREMPL